MKRIVILQPSYLPWLGHFDQIRQADTFVFYDDVQYTRRDWRNRNRIKLSSGEPGYLTIPVKVKGKYDALINEIEIDSTQQWQRKHLNAITHAYRKAPHFDEIFALLEAELLSAPSALADFTISLTKNLGAYLDLETDFERSSTETVTYNDPTDHLVKLCQRYEATQYLSGDSARVYLDETQFNRVGIEVEFHGYQHPEYQQLWGAFASHLSVVDALFNHGKETKNILTNQRPVDESSTMNQKEAAL